MLNYIWALIIAISVVTAIFTGHMNSLSDSVLSGAQDAVELLISVVGSMCFWSGMMEVADKGGVTKTLSKAFSPILLRLFKGVHKDSDAMKYISLNVSANLLGLGNAATPFGLSAMSELKKLSGNTLVADDNMLLFVVLNTASIQLLPTTLCTYRGVYGSTSPFEIIPAVWITSVVALTVGIITAKTISKVSR